MKSIKILEASLKNFCKISQIFLAALLWSPCWNSCQKKITRKNHNKIINRNQCKRYGNIPFQWQLGLRSRREPKFLSVQVLPVLQHSSAGFFLSLEQQQLYYTDQRKIPLIFGCSVSRLIKKNVWIKFQCR